jgi:hypothetical protein
LINYAKVPDHLVKSGSGSGSQNAQVAEAGRKMLAAAGLKISSPALRSGANTLVTPASQGQLFEAGVKRASMMRYGEDDASITISEDDVYVSHIPELPEPNPDRRVDQARLREIRRKLDVHCSAKEIEALFKECLYDAVEICTDYIGNVVIQKLFEKGSDIYRVKLLGVLGPHLAAIGVHKNGTWAVQKIVDYCKTTAQINLLISSLNPLIPALLLDQYGNYVVQCLLKVWPLSLMHERSGATGTDLSLLRWKQNALISLDLDLVPELFVLVLRAQRVQRVSSIRSRPPLSRFFRGLIV